MRESLSAFLRRCGFRSDAIAEAAEILRFLRAKERRDGLVACRDCLASGYARSEDGLVVCPRCGGWGWSLPEEHR